MPNRPSIVLAGRQPAAVAPGLESFLGARERNIDRGRQDVQQGLNQRKMQLGIQTAERAAQATATADRARESVRSQLIAKNMLERGDTQGAIAMLEARAQRLGELQTGGSHVTPDHTLELIAQLQGGDTAGALASIGGELEVAERMGVIEPRENAVRIGSAGSASFDQEGNIISQAGFKPPAPTRAPIDKLVSVPDPSSPTGYRYSASSAAAGQPAPAPKGGISFSSGPEGVSFSTGGQPQQRTLSGLDKTGSRKERDNLATLERTRGRLNDIAASFDPELLTFGGRLSTSVSQLKDKAGFSTPEDKEAITAWRKFSQNVNSEFNSYRKLITGAAASVQEMEDLKKAMISTDLGPTEFRVAFDTYRSEMVRSMEISARLLREGVDITSGRGGRAFDEIFTAGIGKDWRARGEELEAQGVPNREIPDRLKAEGYVLSR